MIEVQISPEMLEKLEALPGNKCGQKGREWTAEQDAALLKYWRVKRQEDVAKLLGVNTSLARKRYIKLTSE